MYNVFSLNLNVSVYYNCLQRPFIAVAPASERGKLPGTRRAARLPWGTTIAGPAVIEQTDTTVWIEPGVETEVLEGGALLLRRTAP